jgi:hypothetical protein
VRALNITGVDDVLLKSIASLYRRIFAGERPLRKLCIFDLTTYLLEGKTTSCTITHHVVSYGLSPVYCTFNKCIGNSYVPEEGVIDSLSQLIYHDNF